MGDIDVRQIMFEIETRGFSKSLQDLSELAKENGLEIELEKLFTSSLILRRFTHAHINHKGKFFLLMNFILAVFSKILFKCFEPILKSQERFNEEMIRIILKYLINSKNESEKQKE